ncbi:S-layer homology domain-containing protein [Bacillus benzoevorans]|uniref:SLH domain-containing protein n=1 Tax=Bacillus benzoevorans TaxID=1456 RepID=A0A7X0LXQ2_9BACI|nr:S-layer homology domain-containing protein [Bacillus benzoevorans]MBB6446727.1 hypothetical protein [Bacillus benzoevorans]
MKRKWLLLLTFVCVLAFSLPQGAAADGSNVSDIKGHWAEKDIQKLIDNGAVSGFSDGTFRPNQTITRAEFVKIVVRMFDLKSTDGKNLGMFYKDTYGEEYTKDPFSAEGQKSLHWAVEEINIATNLGIVKGTGDNRFTPNAPIIREQMALIIHNLIYTATPFPLQELSNTPLDKILIVNKFKDASSIYGGATDPINTLVILKIMQGDKNGYFLPKKHATRAEAAAILSRVLDKVSNQDVEIVFSNVTDKRIEKEMPAKIKDWYTKAEEETHLWYEEDGVYAAARKWSNPCNGMILKGIEKTEGKTTVTFQNTYPHSSDFACIDIGINYAIIIKLPPTEKVEIEVLK